MGNVTPRAIARMEFLKPITGNHHGQLRATAVIVLYGMASDESPSFRSLVEARKNLPAHEADVPIVLWDNSPSPHLPAQLPNEVTYHHDPRNLGLAFAYNQALEVAARNGSEWSNT